VDQKKESRTTANLFLVRYPEEPIRVPDKGEVTIGRADTNDIVLSEPRVSRKHAVIEWLEPPGLFVLTDLGSSNGTYLNAKKLPVNYPGFLNDWDKIRIASAVFTVRVVENPVTIMSEFKELRDRAQLEVTEVIRLNEIHEALARPGFSGDLLHLCPVELFQMLEVGAKTGVLTLETETGAGTYAVLKGAIVTASFNERDGAEAVYAILSQNKGSFAFCPQDIVEGGQPLGASITSLLMEGCRRLDEASAGG
jgi:pSer/pThr/pTyr-binding forkhead associated (FHA) protein